MKSLLEERRKDWDDL